MSSDPRVEGLGQYDDDDDGGSEKKMQKKNKKNIRNINFPKRRNSKSDDSGNSSSSSSLKSGGRGERRRSSSRDVDIDVVVGCFSCLKPRKSSESNIKIERQTSDPNSSEFTKEMLRDLIEKNDFYSKECNPFALDHQMYH